MPDRFTFLADTPDLSTFEFPAATIAEVPDDARPPTSQIQLFKTGRFKHPRWGRAQITRDTYDGFIRNFAAGTPNDRLPVDFDHAPQVSGDTRACGWITALQARGDELWATVEWTWAGAYAIREREYRYVSPTFTLAFVSDDETGRGPVLVGAALTNYPFLEGMAVVSLSRSLGRDDVAFAEDDEDVEPATEAAPDVSDSRAAMSTFANIAKQLGLAEDSSEEQVLTAARELQTKADREPEVPEGHVVLTASVVADLTAKANLGETAARELAEMRFSTAFEKAVADGKAAPAQREHFAKIFTADEETAIALIDSLSPIVQTAARGDAGDRTDAPDGVDADRYDLDRKVQAYAREHNVDYPAALDAVIAQGGER